MAILSTYIGAYAKKYFSEVEIESIEKNDCTEEE